MLRLALAALLCLSLVSAKRAINGTRCMKNQVISRLTVFEDGTLEAECGPVPCGEVGRRCIEDQTSCRADTDVFSGMRWAPNGQSVLLRCCTIKVPNKIYVGTDLVTAGSYYEGGPIAKKDMYYPKGKEYDFIANVRTEQGGVRVWVYRVACGDDDQRVEFEQVVTQPPVVVPARPVVESEAPAEPKPKVESDTEGNEEEAEEEEGEEEEGEEEEEEATNPPQEFNPLRYRPPNVQRSPTGTRRS
ncbi:hypothetical protein Y032_0045g1271 [Ancylostoma ceylanicum]|uniref:Uncharacterized protein n=1 Tax=Ancylostoma ceylanicum TaxID=53326 RepID=A0A016UET8_9BILA|nr:hypothetical protein Y032_0045g1271 [Ancylostoma ceylanicum]